MTESLYGDGVRPATVDELSPSGGIHGKEDRMARSTAGNPFDDLTHGLRRRLAETVVPAASDVESELRRLALERLGRSTGGDVAPPSRPDTRSIRVELPQLVGAYDSPAGFAFASNGAHRKR